MIALRKLALTDLDAVHDLVSNMDVVRHMLFPLCSREDSEKFLRDSMLESPSDPWRSIVRAICLAPGEDLVGLCGVVILRGAEEGEIWYLVSPQHWGRGIAAQAAKLLLRFAFSELGLHRAWASCLPENPASVRVLEKAGMRKEGFLVENLKIHGVWKSSFLYAILADEWKRNLAGPAPGAPSGP